MRLRLVIFLCLLILSPKIFPQNTVKNDSIDRKILKRAVLTKSTFYLGGMSYLGFIWYKDKERVPFHFYNDGKGYLQVDKWGHAYGAYLESAIGYQWLRKAGVDKKRALIYGGGLGFILQAPIEVFDGLYEGWGFSVWDLAANLSGALLVVGQEALLDSQPIRLKFSFRRSVYAEQGHGYLGDTQLESLFLDYNGHTYWLSGGLHHMFPAIPPWINLAVGYSGDGMYGEFSNRNSYGGKLLPSYDRSRQILFSLDVNWSEIKTNKKLLKHVFYALDFIKIPFPALQYKGGEGVRGYWMYF